MFLGDDKKVSTKVEINGSLDDPKYSTEIIKDSAIIPIDIIRRIINLPNKAIKSIFD